jgi:signal peptidase I
MIGLGGSRTILYGGLLLTGLVCLAQPLRLGVVRGESMAPTLRDGQPYLLNTRAYTKAAPQRGDVVVFRRDNVTYIKRVLAVGGDSLLLGRGRGDNDDALIDVRQVTRMKRLESNRRMPGYVHLHTLKVPADSVYVVGDARQLSQDSRSFGPVPISSILGRVSAPPAPVSRPIAANFRSPATL